MNTDRAGANVLRSSNLALLALPFAFDLSSADEAIFDAPWHPGVNGADAAALKANLLSGYAVSVAELPEKRLGESADEAASTADAQQPQPQAHTTSREAAIVEEADAGEVADADAAEATPDINDAEDAVETGPPANDDGSHAASRSLGNSAQNATTQQTGDTPDDADTDTTPNTDDPADTGTDDAADTEEAADTDTDEAADADTGDAEDTDAGATAESAPQADTPDASAPTESLVAEPGEVEAALSALLEAMRSGEGWPGQLESLEIEPLDRAGVADMLAAIAAPGTPGDAPDTPPEAAGLANALGALAAAIAVPDLSGLLEAAFGPVAAVASAAVQAIGDAAAECVDAVAMNFAPPVQIAHMYDQPDPAAACAMA